MTSPFVWLWRLFGALSLLHLNIGAISLSLEISLTLRRFQVNLCMPMDKS